MTKSTPPPQTAPDTHPQPRNSFINYYLGIFGCLPVRVQYIPIAGPAAALISEAFYRFYRFRLLIFLSKSSQKIHAIFESD